MKKGKYVLLAFSSYSPFERNIYRIYHNCFNIWNWILTNSWIYLCWGCNVINPQIGQARLNTEHQINTWIQVIMNSTSTKSTQTNTEHQNINWISQTSQNLCEGFAMSTVFQRLSLRLPNWDTHIKMRLMPRLDGDEDTANVELAWQVAFGDLGLGNWASLSSDLGLGIILPLERFSCHSLITPASYQPS